MSQNNYAGLVFFTSHSNILFYRSLLLQCPVCSSKVRTVTVSPTTTLNELIQQLCDGDLRLKSPNMTTAGQILRMQKPPALEVQTRPNLNRPLKELITAGEEISVTDPALQHAHLSLAVLFEN